jgi:hypothetical protein
MLISLGVRTIGAANAAAAWEIRTGTTPGRAKLIEIGFFVVAATKTVIGLGRPAAIGVTPSSPVDFLPEDPNDVVASGVVQSSLSWATGPTVPVAFLRRVSLPDVVGTGVIWTFPKGITIPVSSGLVLWNLSTNSVLDAYAVIEI